MAVSAAGCACRAAGVNGRIREEIVEEVDDGGRLSARLLDDQ
jgi:hypothetical protein